MEDMQFEINLWVRIRSLIRFEAMRLSFKRCGFVPDFVDFVPRAMFNFDNHPHWFVGQIEPEKNCKTKRFLADSFRPHVQRKGEDRAKVEGP